MREIRKNIDLHAFGEEVGANSGRYKYTRLIYRTNVSGETDVEIEPITDGFLIRASAYEVEAGTPVTTTVETPENRSDALVSIRSNRDVVDLVRIQFPDTVNEHGWREAEFTWTPERPGVYEISVDGGESTVVRAYRVGGRT